MNCCVNCFNNDGIIEEIIDKGIIGDCNFCDSKEVNICSVDSDILFEARDIIFHLNPSQSGFEMQRFVTKQINVFNSELPLSVINDLILKICTFLNPDDLDRNYEMPYFYSELVREWDEFKNSIKHKNRFGNGISDNLLNSLKYILTTNRYSIDKDQIYFRARIGSKVHKATNTFGYPGEEEFDERIVEKAFSHKEIMAPPPELVTEGRLNPRGISYLYVAESDQTAIAEVRPHKNNKVSVARVRTNDSIEVSCFDNTTFFEVTPLETQISLYLLTNYLNIEFSKPINDDTRYIDYLPTQYVSELAKNQEIEGIRYSSSLDEEGTNFCIFSTEKVDFEDSGIATVSSVNLTIETPDFYRVGVLKDLDGWDI